MTRDDAARVVLITGAGLGMGRAHALELARRGALVGVNDINGDHAEATARAIEADGGQALALQGDVSVRAEMEGVVRQLAIDFGPIDAFVSNAGTAHSGVGIAETDYDEWRRSFAVHVDGALFGVQACLPYLLRSPQPRIVLVSSMWGQGGHRHSHAYCAAKGALIAFAKSLARELGPRSISVNAIAPGGVYTRMTTDLTQEELEHEFNYEIPLQRYAEPEEIARLVAYLVLEDSGFITGQTLAINGGQLISGC